MIEAQHAIAIGAGIDEVWDYVQDMQRWAHLFPGCQGCELRTRDESDWTIKIGAGGLVKTVIVQVQVQRWAQPDQVDFSFRLKSEPVHGSGRYQARSTSAGETEVAMHLRVEGSGPMAPMWEAVSRPLLPQLARIFSESLRAEIEGLPRPTLMGRLRAWLLGLWHKLLGKSAMQSQETRG